MSLYKQYETDNNKEVSGIPVEFGANEDGSVPTIIISRIGESNKEYTKALRIATKPYQRQIEMKTLSPEKDNEIYRDVFASAVIKGWSNIFDRDNNPLPFTKENAVRLLTDLPDLYKVLQVSANDASLFRKHALDAEAKN